MAIPEQLGPYDLFERIASGGMADVYLARLALGANAYVALKVLKDDFSHDPYHVGMFADECRLARVLSHPTTVQIYDHGEEDGRHYIAMELLVGQSLQQAWDAHRARRARMPWDVVAWIGARVCDGLHHAHELRDPNGEAESVVHRDVNPSNVFLTYDGRVKVIDFGLAKAKMQAVHTYAGVLKGKVAYLSPEQFEGMAPDRRADLFALATTLWELATDRRLFRRGTDLESAIAVAECEVPDPRAVVRGFPPELWSVLRRGLAKDPDRRYATAAEMGRALDRCVREMGRGVSPHTVADVLREGCNWAAR
jgi:serine/threonine-protein kinase